MDWRTGVIPNEAELSVELTDAEELETTFASLLGRAALQKRVVVLLDALNQFAPTVRAQHLTWWPKLWPENARVIATAVPGSASTALEQRPGIGAVALPLLTEIEAQEIVHAVCRRYHRTIHPDVVQQLLEKQTNGRLAAGIPLWLELAVEELNLLDADDFQRAETEYVGTPEQRLHQLLLETAQNLPATVAEIYSAMLERTEKIAGKSLACGFANVITLSRSGWREDDLEDLLPRVTGENEAQLNYARFLLFALAAQQTRLIECFQVIVGGGGDLNLVLSQSCSVRIIRSRTADAMPALRRSALSKPIAERSPL